MIKELGKAISNKIKNASFDKTLDGSILKVLPSNTYVVLCNGKEYTVTTQNNTKFVECQKVHVHIPQNDWKKIRILEDMNMESSSSSSGVSSVNGKKGDVVLGIDDIENLNSSLNNASSHISSTSNPHSVTKSQIGLSNVPNVTTNNQTPSFTQATSRVNINTGETLSILLGKVSKWFADLKTVAFSGSYNDLSDTPTSLPANGGNADTVGGFTVNANVPSNAKFTDIVTTINGKTGTISKSDIVALGIPAQDTNTTYTEATTSTDGLMASGDKIKLNGIEDGAEVNNISDTNATNLTSGANTTLHYHTSDRNRANHTGTQTSSTISDFATTVRNTVLTGLSTATNTVITTADNILGAFGKIQAQISNILGVLTSHIENTSNPHSVTKAQIGLGSVDNTSDSAKNVLSATKLTTARTINGVSFNGSANITITANPNAHTQSASTITDFDTEVSNNVDVSANTSARHSHSNKSVLDNTTASYTTTEKTKLSGIATNANNYSLPIATSTVLGGIKSGTDIKVDTSGNVSVNDDSHNHVIANVDGLQSALNNKINTSLIDNNSNTGTLWTSEKIVSFFDSNLPTTTYQYSGTVGTNTTVSIIIPSATDYKSGSLEVLRYINNRWEKAIHGIDYVYWLISQTELNIEFFTAGIYKANYLYVASGNMTWTVMSSSEPGMQNVNDFWLEKV